MIDKAGMVVDPVVLSSPDKRLDALAVEAVASWRYEPARINGKRIPVFWTITITFQVPEPFAPMASPTPSR
ncbi:MAG: TonB family protein [Acidobacteria bacterium]|nr:TonB family protein [Acidobacteriota bacterium]